MGGVNFESLAFQFGEASINYGMFIQSVINFFLIALLIFFTMRAVVALEKSIKAQDEQTVVEEPELPQDVALLTEIRDLMIEKSGTE